MPIRIYFENDPNQACTIRPTPLISIRKNTLKDGAGKVFGVTNALVLTGTILPDMGTPYARKAEDNTLYPFWGSTIPTFIGPYLAFDNSTSHATEKPAEQKVTEVEASNAIFFKQKALRALFARDGQRVEVTDFNDNEPTIVAFPRHTEVSFAEGIYVSRCDYTITMDCDTILNKDLQVNIDDTTIPSTSGGIPVAGVTEDTLIEAMRGSFIQDYSDEWNIEVDEGIGESTLLPRSYRVTHSVNAVGKTHYYPDNNDETNVREIPAWESARKFVQSRLSINRPAYYISGIPYPNVMGMLGSGTLNLVASYQGFNHVMNEQVSESAGSYGVVETWLIASGSAYENYNLSIQSSIDNPYVQVSIEGNVRGLSQIPPSGFGASGWNTAYQNALDKYHTISNYGQFGLSSDIYKRCNRAVEVYLNSQPKSVAVGVNEFAGDISYSLQFDNRPTNIISGVLGETISVNDTYPGDVFAIIPVLGRQTGPVLSYIGSRTEYRRDVSLSFTLDYTKIPYGQTRQTLLLQKPSVQQPMANQIAALINELSPARESGIRKYFVNPPQESWSPKEGNYNLSISWVYELAR